MRSIRQSSKGIRLAALLALIAALVLGGELAHDHSALDSPDVCATCTVKVHAAATLTPAPDVAPILEPDRLLVAATPRRPSAIARPALRSRAPPSLS